MNETAACEVVFDDISAHISDSVPLEKAAVPLGVYLSWCANLQLVHPEFAATHDTDVLRVRMRELTPGEFLVRAAGGTLRADQLSERGRRFTEVHYGDYLRAYADALGLDEDRLFEAPDSWDTYDRVARWLTGRYFAFAEAGHRKKDAYANGRADEGRRRWWQIWR